MLRSYLTKPVVSSNPGNAVRSQIITPGSFFKTFTGGVTGLLTRRVGKNLICTPYMTVYLEISQPKIPYTHRVYRVLANPNYTGFPDTPAPPLTMLANVCTTKCACQFACVCAFMCVYPRTCGDGLACTGYPFAGHPFQRRSTRQTLQLR
jgi:hypothetical protein